MFQVILTVDEGKAGNRLNDGKCDAKGRLWAGTMGPNISALAVEPNQGSLFKIGPAASEI